MKRNLIVGVLVGLAVAYAGGTGNMARFQVAVAQALTAELPDTCVAQDARDIWHRAYVDTAGVWYQTSDQGGLGHDPNCGEAIESCPAPWTVPIRMAGDKADNPLFAIMAPEGAAGQGGTLVLFWRQQEDAAVMVRCRWHRHPDPFWRWSSQVVVAVQ